VGAGAGANDLDAPSVWDMQIAYSFSSEVTGVNRTGTAPLARWAYAVGSSVNPVGKDWFEARQMRFSMLVAGMRQMTETAGIVSDPASENGAVIPLPIERGRFRLTAGEVFASLRMFDKVVPKGISAEPY
jgi:hypothetical protein